MIEKARQNSAQAGLWARFEAAGFGELAQTFGQYSFNALLCLGNSLPHLLSPGALQEALLDFSRVIVPGGLLILQNCNFDAVMRSSPALDGAAGVPGGGAGVAVPALL